MCLWTVVSNSMRIMIVPILLLWLWWETWLQINIRLFWPSVQLLAFFLMKWENISSELYTFDEMKKKKILLKLKTKRLKFLYFLHPCLLPSHLLHHLTGLHLQYIREFTSWSKNRNIGMKHYFVKVGNHVKELCLI